MSLYLPSTCYESSDKFGLDNLATANTTTHVLLCEYTTHSCDYLIIAAQTLWYLISIELVYHRANAAAQTWSAKNVFEFINKFWIFVKFIMTMSISFPFRCRFTLQFSPSSQADLWFLLSIHFPFQDVYVSCWTKCTRIITHTSSEWNEKSRVVYSTRSK